MASPVFKTAWAAVRSPEGSTPFLLRRVCKGFFGQIGELCLAKMRRLRAGQ